MQERRDFLKQLALITGSLMLPIHVGAKPNEDKWGKILPLRKLGKTGEYVTMLGVGGYHIGWTTKRDAQEVIETAMAGGIRFFDTAESYDKGGSEIKYGKYLIPKYRDQIFLMSKTTAVDSATAAKHLDESLKRLNCDYLDLWQVHSLSTPDDVDRRIENEVLEVFEKAKSQGKVKHIGFTGHQNPFAHKRMFEATVQKDIFETIQIPINAIDPHFHSFIKNAMPIALDRNFGVLAMKTLADGRFFKEKKMKDKVIWKTEKPVTPDHLSIREALYYSWSLPISVLITGAENKKMLQEKIDLANQFTNMSESQRIALVERLADVSNEKVEYYKKI